MSAPDWNDGNYYVPNFVVQRFSVLYQATAVQPNIGNYPELDAEHVYWIVYNSGGGNTVVAIDAGVGITVTNGSTATPTVSANLIAGNAGITLAPGVPANSLAITNAGVTSVIGTAGQIGVSSATGDVTLTNLGVTQVTGGTGISASAGTGSVTLTNSGVTQLIAGNGVTLSGATGNVTVSCPTAFTGLQGIAGYANPPTGYGLQVYGTPGQPYQPYISLSTTNSIPNSSTTYNFDPGVQEPFEMSVGANAFVQLFASASNGSLTFPPFFLQNPFGTATLFASTPTNGGGDLTVSINITAPGATPNVGGPGFIGGEYIVVNGNGVVADQGSAQNNMFVTIYDYEASNGWNSSPRAVYFQGAAASSGGGYTASGTNPSTGGYIGTWQISPGGYFVMRKYVVKNYTTNIIYNFYIIKKF